MQKKIKIIAALMAAFMLIGIAACGADEPAAPQAEGDPGASIAPASPVVAGSAVEGQGQEITLDREGNPIILPDRIERIISMGPSNTEVLVALGFGDIIIAADDYSSNIAGINPDIPMFSMMQPDGEQIINLMPDVMFVTGMSRAGGNDPFRVVADAGICLIYMPSSSSIEAIKEDIIFMASIMGVVEKGAEIIAEMESEIERISMVGATIAERKSVYFEVAAAPHMVSFGTGVFLDEMIELVGAVNVLADLDGWKSVSDEVIMAADPDVILTSVNYIAEPIIEIKTRPGWDAIKAVSDDAVFYIDTDASNRPSHNIVIALREIALAVYPEFYS